MSEKRNEPEQEGGERIRSRQNPRIVQARKIARDPRLARREGVLIADGITLVREALAAGLHDRMVLVDSADPDAEPIIADAKRRRAVVTPVSRAVLEAVSTLATAQGAFGIFDRPGADLTSLLTAPDARGWPVVAILHGLQDPTNAGSLIRTGLAAGVDGFVATEGTVDPWHARAARASMGACFRIPIVADAPLPAVLEGLRRGRYRLIALDPRGETALGDLRLDQPTAIVFGREGSGLDQDTLRACNTTVRIPMAKGVESLGVAAAGAIAFYSLLMR